MENVQRMKENTGQAAAAAAGGQNKIIPSRWKSWDGWMLGCLVGCLVCLCLDVIEACGSF